MRKLICLVLVCACVALGGVWLTELLTFDIYAAEVASRGITHAELVEQASLLELAFVSLPWALALAMLAQWLLFTPQHCLLRNLSRWLALISPLMALEGIFLHEDILRSLLHMDGPFIAPAIKGCCSADTPWKFVGKYEVKRTMDKVQNSARSARMMNDEGRLALVETICAQRSELFIRKSPATAKPSAETGHSSIVLPYNFPFFRSQSTKKSCRTLRNGSPSGKKYSRRISGCSYPDPA